MNGSEEPNVLNKHPVSTDESKERQMLEEEWFKEVAESEHDFESLIELFDLKNDEKDLKKIDDLEKEDKKMFLCYRMISEKHSAEVKEEDINNK